MYEPKIIKYDGNGYNFFECCVLKKIMPKAKKNKNFTKEAKTSKDKVLISQYIKENSSI
jgi:hypothetical protein